MNRTPVELSPYLKGMIGEGLIKEDVAAVLNRLQSMEQQRLAFRELKQAQVSTAENIVTKLGWTSHPKYSELDIYFDDLWETFRNLANLVAGICMIPFVVLFCLAFFFR